MAAGRRESTPDPHPRAIHNSGVLSYPRGKNINPRRIDNRSHTKKIHMQYKIEIKPLAIKDGKKIPKGDLVKIFKKIEDLKDDLKGNVKHLTNFTPEYRLRVGDYRVLFEIHEQVITIYRIKHRKNAYK